MRKPFMPSLYRALLCCSFAIVVSASLLHAEENVAVEFLHSGKILPKNLPFSEAVRVGDIVYLSGQIGVIPGTIKIIAGGMHAEAKQTLENIQTILHTQGLSMSNIVKCTVMLADMSEWAAFNEVYASFFEQPYPARSAFGTSGLALGARVEVECIAVVQE